MISLIHEYEHTLRVKLGNSPLPFFAEYPYFLWGEVNYDSEGDCKKPTDRSWEFLFLDHRDNEGDDLEIRKVKGEKAQIYKIEGANLKSVRLATYLTILRTEGYIIGSNSSHKISASELEKEIDKLDKRLADAEQIRTMFLNPVLAPFDSRGWWGGWKWCGDRATEFTMGLRFTMKAVTEQDADQEFINHLYDWWNEPPQPFHREGVRYAIKTLTGKEPMKRNFLMRWFGRKG